MEIIAIYYTFVLIFIGAVGSLAISICGEVYEMDYCLKDKKEFAKCVFMYQVAAKMMLEMYDVNLFGIVVLEILTTFSVWFLNVIIFLRFMFIAYTKSNMLFILDNFQKKKKNMRIRQHVVSDRMNKS